MELELNCTQINCFESVLDTILTQEETSESIVPDACPDILRLVETAGTLCLKTKELTEGRIQLAGTVFVSVLYLPETDCFLRRITIPVPFVCTMTDAAISSGGRLMVVPRLCGVEGRVLNPRKLMVRAELSFHLRVWQPTCMNLCNSVSSDAADGVQQLVGQCEPYCTMCVQEKSFTFSDEFPLSGSRASAEEILLSNVSIACSESKIIGNKLVFKGEANLHILYRTHTGMLGCADYPLPFSQIMEITNSGEDAVCDLEVTLSALECEIGNGGEDGSHMLFVTATLLAQAVVREQKSSSLVRDLYSTQWELMTEMSPCHLSRLGERSSAPQSVRELLETVSPASSVLDTRATVISISQRRDGERLTLTAVMLVEILYLTEADLPEFVSRRINVDCSVACRSDMDCTAACRPMGDLFTTPAAGGIELRMTAEFSWVLLAKLNLPQLKAARVDREHPLGGTQRPSVILRLTDTGEQLWDVAKRYGTTREDICSANELTEDQPVGGRMLLIPKSV